MHVYWAKNKPSKMRLSFLCSILLLSALVLVAQPARYTPGDGAYRVVELDGFEPAPEARVWDLSRLAATGFETPLRFDYLSDSVFTATTSDTRQTFSIVDGSWLLTRSETPTSVGILSPGVPVRGNVVNNYVEMRGRTYQHDHYYGAGSGTLEVFGCGRLIRRDGDTIDNASLDRRTVALRVVSGPQPISGLSERPDSLSVDCRRTTYTWRDSDGRALAQAVKVSYIGAKGELGSDSASYLIIAEDAPASYSRRSHGESSSTPTARLDDHGVTLSGLEHDFADTGVVVADVAGRVYYSGKVDSGGGTVSIRTPLPPSEVIITVTQSETTTFKLTR